MSPAAVATRSAPATTAAMITAAHDPESQCQHDGIKFSRKKAFG
jgi:hypothetical protein